MCSKTWPLEGSTRLSSAVRSAPAAEDRLDSRTSTALTRSPPQPFRMSSSTVGFWFGKIFFNTSKGGRLAFKLKGRETVPDGPSIRRWLCSAWYLGLSGQLSGLPPFFCTAAYPPSSTDTISGLSGVKQFLLLTTSGELLWSVSLSLKVSAALSPELLSPSRSSVKSGLASWAGSVPGWGLATQRSAAAAANSAAGRGGAGVWDACEAGDDSEAVAAGALAEPAASPG